MHDSAARRYAQERLAREAEEREAAAKWQQASDAKLQDQASEQILNWKVRLHHKDCFPWTYIFVHECTCIDRVRQAYGSQTKQRCSLCVVHEPNKSMLF
jgi:hypothetical protein